MHEGREKGSFRTPRSNVVHVWFRHRALAPNGGGIVLKSPTGNALVTSAQEPPTEPPSANPPASAGDGPRRRRPRYGGTHPRRFDEKYKELDPARYPAEIEKVRARGHTPAGSHVPVMLNEVVDALQPRPNEIALDCTLGHGGHAAALAARVAPDGFVIGLDWDSDELARTRADLEGRGLAVRARRSNFAGAAAVLEAEGLTAVDLVLADLGVSSMQLDRPDRGFSLKHDGPLDMRMDRSRGQPASGWLASATVEEIAGVLDRFGDEPDSDRIAQAITARFAERKPLRSTRDLVEVVLRAKRIDPRTFKQESAFTSHPAARTFQALRMATNREIENLAQLLRTLPWITKSGGRIAIISFHRGEDRMVSDAFARGLAEGTYSAISADPVLPARTEVHDNPRARSARLRWAVRA